MSAKFGFKAIPHWENETEIIKLICFLVLAVLSVTVLAACSANP